MPFEKGKSGNPSGRPKVLPEVKALAQANGAAAFERVVTLMASEDERVALAAAQEVLNRAYGKSVQHTDNKTEVKYSYEAELKEIAQRIGAPVPNLSH